MNYIKSILPTLIAVTLMLCSGSQSIASNTTTTQNLYHFKLDCSSGCNGDTAITLNINDTLAIEITYPVYPIKWMASLRDSLFLVPIKDSIVSIPNRIGTQMYKLNYICPSSGIDTLFLESVNSLTDSLFSMYIIELKIK